MRAPSILAILLAMVIAVPLRADVELTAFDHALHNSGSRTIDGTFVFPPASMAVERITLEYRLSCPGPPGDCDPWDRTARLFALREVEGQEQPEALELARSVTPYDITGTFGGPFGTGPDSCSFVFDLTAYQSVLRDSVTLRSWVDTWIGGQQAWLVTTVFTFEEGVADPEPYRVVRLWENGHIVYGNPANAWSDQLPGRMVEIDPGAEAATLRVITTGHGQGNTDNAAEFSQKLQHALVGMDSYFHLLWRDDCSQNPCSGQSGYWWYDRAGWCPGAGVEPWDQPLAATAGEELFVDYWAEGYVNECRPNNPDCVSGQTCLDCEYNSNGHTEPHYVSQGQLIFYRTPATRVGAPPLAPGDLRLLPATPNPFNPSTDLRLRLEHSAPARLAVFDLLGRRVALLHDGPLTAGEHRFRFEAGSLPSGLYVAALQAGGQRRAVKLLLAR